MDEINDDAGHELAIAAIQIAYGRATPQSAADALDVALVACHRGLEGLRRVRRMLEAASERAQGSEPFPEEVARLRAVAATSGATLAIADDLPGTSELPAGLMLTAFRTVEALLRFTAGRGARVALGCEGRCLRLVVDSAVEPGAWLRPERQVERVRERLRWFDGRLLVEPRAGGSVATIEIPAD